MASIVGEELSDANKGSREEIFASAFERIAKGFVGQLASVFANSEGLGVFRIVFASSFFMASVFFASSFLFLVFNFVALVDIVLLGFAAGSLQGAEIFADIDLLGEGTGKVFGIFLTIFVFGGFFGSSLDGIAASISPGLAGGKDSKR